VHSILVTRARGVTPMFLYYVAKKNLNSGITTYSKARSKEGMLDKLSRAINWCMLVTISLRKQRRLKFTQPLLLRGFVICAPPLGSFFFRFPKAICLGFPSFDLALGIGHLAHSTKHTMT